MIQTFDRGVVLVNEVRLDKLDLYDEIDIFVTLIQGKGTGRTHSQGRLADTTTANDDELVLPEKLCLE